MDALDGHHRPRTHDLEHLGEHPSGRDPGAGAALQHAVRVVRRRIAVEAQREEEAFLFQELEHGPRQADAARAEGEVEVLAGLEGLGPGEAGDLLDQLELEGGLAAVEEELLDLTGRVQEEAGKARHLVPGDDLAGVLVDEAVAAAQRTGRVDRHLEAADFLRGDQSPGLEGVTRR
jgi:hypothetical protein